MARVTLMTRWATYQGAMDLRAPTGQPVRFLDALNHPHRLIEGAGRAVPSLMLSEATRRNEVTGEEVRCGQVGIRPGAVVAAYELEPGERREPQLATVYEARRQSQDSVPVFIYLENGFRIECVIAGGTVALDPGKVGRDFAACREARVIDLRQERPRQLSFLAINVRRLEASGPLPGTETAAREAGTAS
jgi:hypothetical protein